MNHAEAVAKIALESVIPGTMIYQLEQSHGECDFQLHYRSGENAAVEVTASADQEQLQTIAAIRDRNGFVITMPGARTAVWDREFRRRAAAVP